jgi:hypothetical protein
MLFYYVYTSRIKPKIHIMRLSGRRVRALIGVFLSETRQMDQAFRLPEVRSY